MENIANKSRVIRLLEILTSNIQRIADTNTCICSYLYAIYTIKDKDKLEKILDSHTNIINEYNKVRCEYIHRLAADVIAELEKEKTNGKDDK